MYARYFNIRYTTLFLFACCYKGWLVLQDLLHHTGHGHPDRMSLQLALTQLESLAELLNERKREAEQSQAFREMLRAISGKLSVKNIGDNNRCLLRQDDVTQMVQTHCSEHDPS